MAESQGNPGDSVAAGAKRPGNKGFLPSSARRKRGWAISRARSATVENTHLSSKSGVFLTDAPLRMPCVTLAETAKQR
jgi:hypothetical protein